MTTSAKSVWSFDLVSSAIPRTILPNVKVWDVTNEHGLSYQILLSWPLTWTSPEEANGSALSMYVLDGNALGITATEAWRRRAFIDPSQPDGIVISIGYPMTDSVYSAQRNTDFQTWTPKSTTPTLPSARQGADHLLDFIGGTLRPFVRSQFPKVTFDRDCLYGHSFGGLFVVYTIICRSGLFDTYLAASPGAANWNIEYISNWMEKAANSDSKNKPALRLAFGGLEAQPLRRRTETEEAFRARTGFYASFDVGTNTKAIYQKLRGNSNLKDVEIKEYPWSDHASLGAVALTDGIDYFVDW